MKVYLVSQGSHSDYCIRGALSSKEKAEIARIFYNADNIEEYELDDLPDNPNGLFRFNVIMKESGDTISVQRRDTLYKPILEWSPNHEGETAEFNVLARDENHAVKIANEHRIRLIESGEFTLNWNEWLKKRKLI